MGHHPCDGHGAPRLAPHDPLHEAASRVLDELSRAQLGGKGPREVAPSGAAEAGPSFMGRPKWGVASAKPRLLDAQARHIGFAYVRTHLPSEEKKSTHKS